MALKKAWKTRGIFFSYFAATLDDEVVKGPFIDDGGCNCRQSGATGAAGTDLVEGGAATPSLSFGAGSSDSSNVLGLLQRDSARYPELYSGMLQHQQLAGWLLH